MRPIFRQLSGLLFVGAVICHLGTMPTAHAAPPVAPPTAPTPAPKTKPSVTAQLAAAKEKIAPKFKLAYKFAAGEEFRTKVIHLATVETKIKGTTGTSKTRVMSTRVWKINSVDDAGNITFVNVVEAVDMWESVTDKKEISYDSTKGGEPPPGYEHIAKGVNVPLATVTISPQGAILRRENALPQFNPGIGELTIPFPPQEIVVGQTWSVPSDLPVRADDGKVVVIKLRMLYKLEGVETGVANISVETQILTPLDDPKIQSQLIQRLQKGKVRFDLDAGRLLHRQMDLDESVLGFNGPDSHMQYLARLTEEPIPATKTNEAAAKKTPTTESR